MKNLQKNLGIRAPLFIYPYREYSDSARLLAGKLRGVLNGRVFRITPTSHIKPRDSDWILNWGCTAIPDWPTYSYNRWFNLPVAVARSANKLATFNTLAEKGINCVQYTSNLNVVHNWLNQDRIVLARTIINGSGGRGIHIIKPGTDPLPASLYTLYQRKDQEFRIHVFKGKVIDVTEKRRRLDAPMETDEQRLIRNHANGWVFCHDGILEPTGIRELAINAIRCLGLDFGAVDIISYEGNNFILEINTAPGIEGTTLQHYSEAIKNALFPI